MAGLAWAVERGFVCRLDGTPWSYAPVALICPVSPRLEQALARGNDDAGRRSLELCVDVDALQASLVEDPVPGLLTIWR
jgi:hypothetical protein